MTYDEKVNALVDQGIVYGADEAAIFLEDMGMDDDDGFDWE